MLALSQGRTSELLKHLTLPGKRNKALAEYRVVLSYPNVYDTYDQARCGQKEPFKEQMRSNKKRHE